MYHKKISTLMFETKNSDLLDLVSEQTSAVDLLSDLLDDLGDDEKKEIFDRVFSNLDTPNSENITKQLEDNPDILQKVMDDPDIFNNILNDLKVDGDLLSKLGVEIPSLPGGGIDLSSFEVTG